MFAGHNYDEKVDIWSAGIVLYLLLVGEPPFDTNHVAQLVQNIRNFDLQCNDI